MSEAGSPEPQGVVQAINPATAEQIEKAEGLIRQAQVSKMRGESGKASRLLEEAAMTAPTAPGVQEALGDAYMEKKMWDKASSAYQRALMVQPDNVGIERKYAEAILFLKSGTNPFLMEGNDVGTFASGRSAVLISVLFPGIGHIVAGKTVPGIIFLSAFLLGCVGAILFGGFGAFFGLFKTQSNINSGALLSLVPPFLAYIWCQFDLAATAKGMEPPKIERPLPPVDKPF